MPRRPYLALPPPYRSVRPLMPLHVATTIGPSADALRRTTATVRGVVDRAAHPDTQRPITGSGQAYQLAAGVLKRAAMPITRHTTMSAAIVTRIVTLLTTMIVGAATRSGSMYADPTHHLARTRVVEAVPNIRDRLSNRGRLSKGGTRGDGVMRRPPIWRLLSPRSNVSEEV
jgi:hypothetical protein